MDDKIKGLNKGYAVGDIKNIFLLVLELPNEVDMSYFLGFFGSIPASLYNTHIYLSI